MRQSTKQPEDKANHSKTRKVPLVQRPQMVRVVLNAVACAVTVACATMTAMAAPITTIEEHPPSLSSLYSRLQSGGVKDEVLNRMEIASYALFLGYLNDAERSLDGALDSIEAVWADSDKAARARGLWHNEGEKDFKGEPYERLMAYYYRGLIHLANGDFENAAVLFKGGLAQDGFAEEAQYRSNFALLMFLEGWAQQCKGNYQAATEYYAETLQFRPDFVIPSRSDTVLAILETGMAPRKIADGMGHGELKFRRGRGFTEARAKLVGDQAEVQLYPMEDIFLKASTRGGRPIDAIIHGKVVFSRSADQTGTVLSDASRVALVAAPIANSAATFSGPAAGTMASTGSSMANAGMVAGIVSIAALTISANTGTRADTRYWGGLPDAIHVATMSAIPSGTLRATYLNLQQTPVADASVIASVRQFDGVCRLIWGRSRAPEPAPAPAN